MKTVCLQLDYHYFDYLNDLQALLKSLNANCQSLESLHIKARTKDAEEFLRSFGKYYCSPNLRELIVPNLKQISAFIKDSKSITTLIIHSVTTAEFNNIHLQRISDKLHKLKYCRIFLTSFHQFKTYSKLAFKPFGMSVHRICVKKIKNEMAIFFLFKNVTTLYTNIFSYVHPLRSFFCRKTDRQTHGNTNRHRNRNSSLDINESLNLKFGKHCYQKWKEQYVGGPFDNLRKNNASMNT